MPNRTYSAQSSYRYGFNGKENDNEVKSEGNQQDYGMRVYDPRIGKFLSVDPLTHIYPYFSPYHFAGNTPIQAVDLDGGEPKGYKFDNPYVKSHPGTGVKYIPSHYDGQAHLVKFDGADMGLMDVYAIQDIDKKTYVIFESATGEKKQQWYVEYDENGWKGNVNSFAWQSPPDPSDVLTAITVTPLLLGPGIMVYGKAALIYLGEELLEEALGFPIIPDPGDLVQYEIKKQLRKEAAEQIVKPQPIDWESVVPKKGKSKGENRIDHVKRHNVDDVSKLEHGVFNGDGVEITNKAWEKAQSMGLAPDQNGTIVIPYSNAGKSGGKNGTGETLNNVTIHFVPGTTQIITAYPSKQ